MLSYSVIICSLILLVKPILSSSWQRGDNVILNVSWGMGDLSYSMSVGGSVWLQGSGASIHCNGKWITSKDGAMSIVSVSNASGHDERLGSFDSLSVVWASSGISLFSTVFKFYPDTIDPAFEFQQV